MSRRKGLRNQEKGNAREEKQGEIDLLDVFTQFREEVRNEIDSFKAIIEELTSELKEKEKKIEELEKKNISLSENIADTETLNEEYIKSVDRIEKKLTQMQGGFVISGKHFHEKVTGDEFVHFSNKFDEKLRMLAQAKSVKVLKPLTFTCRPIGGTAFLARFELVTTDVREDLEKLVLENFVQKDGIFSWNDLKGIPRQVFVKKSRSFIDRKHAQLMYQLYKKVESQNSGSIEKEWKNGQLFINGKEVKIQRNFNSLIATWNETATKVEWG